MAKVGIAIDKLFTEHDNGPGHPETHERILAVADMLRYTNLFNEAVHLEPRDATKDEITLVHNAEYFDKIASTRGKPRVFLDADTSTSARSYEAALRASGAVMSAADSIMSGDVERAFAYVRPPGHHAEADRAMGFCLFNHAAVGAAYLNKYKDTGRVLIVDWDVHHGNGTQHIFYDRSDVLYFSTHQFPFYPGTGALEETGAGEGEGYTVNVPLPPGMGDDEHLAIFSEVLCPVIDQYRPRFILVSAGFDSFYDDPLGGMKVTPEGFAKLTRLLTDKAEEVCGGRIALILEGGYNLDGLWICTKEVTEELFDKKRTEYRNPEPGPRLDSIVDNAKKTHGKYWKF